jgi:hypothetical protein
LDVNEYEYKPFNSYQHSSLEVQNYTNNPFNVSHFNFL